MPKVGSTAARLYGPLARGFGSRVRAAVQRFSSKAEAAKAMGLSTDQVNTLINEAAVPNFAAMAALAVNSGVTLEYLAFDRAGEQKPSTEKSFSAGDDIVSLSRLDGSGSLPFPRVVITTNYDSVLDAALDAARFATMLAPGTAMEPTIKRRALLIVDLSAKRIVDGEIFVFDFTGDLIVRRIQREVDGSLMLRADNPIYEPMKLSPAEAEVAKVLGRVIWRGSEL